MDFKNELELRKRFGSNWNKPGDFSNPIFGDSWRTLESEFETYPFDYYDPDNWKDCPKCVSKPFIWIFDNGSLAKCGCYEYYNDGISAMDIGTYMSQNNGSLLDFPDFELMDNWNDRCRELKIILKGLL